MTNFNHAPYTVTYDENDRAHCLRHGCLCNPDRDDPCPMCQAEEEEDSHSLEEDYVTSPLPEAPVVPVEDDGLPF